MLPRLSLSRFGFSQFTKPVFLSALIFLTISTVFTTFILTGTTAPSLRKFYLLSLRYNPTTTTKLASTISDLLSKDKGAVNFSNIRIGYRGLCIEHSAGWDCARDGPALGHAAGDIGGDPLDLVAIADIYRSKISFSFPFWVATISLGVAWLTVAINCIPGIPIPAWTKKVCAGACTLGTLALLGGMVLQQVTTGAVSTLVDKMGMDAVEVHLGGANVGFGWAAFALAVLATVGVTAVVAAEWGVSAVQQKALSKGEEALEKVRFGGRDEEDQPTRPEKTQTSLGTSSLRSAIVDKGVDYGKGMLAKSMRSK